MLEFQTEMEQIENFTINYWGQEFDYTNPQKEHSKIFKKFGIVGLFIVLVVITPALVLNVAKFNFSFKKEVAKTTEVNDLSGNKIATTSYPTEGKVIKNDSYWKISKRYCGTGEFYLAIQEKNNYKALYEGESVSVICHE